MKLPNITSRKFSLSEASSSCANKQITKSSSLSENLDKLTSTLQIYTTLTKPDIGRSLDTFSKLVHIEPIKPLLSDNPPAHYRSKSPVIDISKFYDQSPVPYSYDNSLEYLNHTTTDSASSSVFGADLPSENLLEVEENILHNSFISETEAEQPEQEDTDTEDLLPADPGDIY